MEGDQKNLKNQSFSKDQHSVLGFPGASLGLQNFGFLSFFGHLPCFLLGFSSPGFEFIGFFGHLPCFLVCFLLEAVPASPGALRLGAEGCVPYHGHNTM